MNEENNYGQQTPTAPVLDDFEYTAPAAKREGPQGVAAPVLDDMGYTAPTQRRDGPQGVAAPVLDDMTDFAQKKPEKLVLSDADIIAGLTPELKQQFDLLPPDKQQQVIEMRRSQLGAEAPKQAVQAAILDDDNYVPPTKKEPEHPAAPVQAAILDDEPEAPKKAAPSEYEQQELERIKQEAAKKAVSSQLVSEQKDKKESLKKMLEIKEDLRRQQAAKGFKMLILLGFVGLIGGVAFYLLYSGQLGLEYKNGLEGLAKVIENSAIYISAGMIIGGFLTLTGVGGLKTLTSLIYILSGIVQIFPGIAMIPQHNGSLGLVALLYAISLICTIAFIAVLSGSECIGQYFSKFSNTINRDYYGNSN